MLFAVLSVFAVPQVSHAQTKLTCTGDIYQVQSGQLRIFDTRTSSYSDVGRINPSYNSLAYNPMDDFFYATRDNKIVLIDANGAMFDLFSIGFNSYIGDIDDDNRMFLRRNSNTVTRVDLATKQQIDITLSQPLASGAADWAFVATPQGQRLIAPGRTQLSIIDLATGQNTVRTIADFPAEGSSGATWSDVNGRVFTFRNTTGNVYEILDYLTPNPRAVLVAVGDPSNSNDGSSCRRAPFPNFPPIAFDDEYTTRFQTPVTDQNMVSGSGNGIDNDPDGGPVEVLADLIKEPENGTVAHQADGTFAYTPNSGFSGTDAFEYEIADITGLTAKAIVTIIVTKPEVSVKKSSIAFGPTGKRSFFVPGHQVVYEIEVRNRGNQEVDPGTLLIVDRWPEAVVLDATSPIAFQEIDSGLDFDETLDVGFSNAQTKPDAFGQCDYEPKVQFDAEVRFICINPEGSLLPDGQATFRLTGKIE